MSTRRNRNGGIVVLTNRNALAVVTAAVIAVFSSGTLHAGPLMFGVVGSPIDLSANVSESILPGDPIFQDSMPIFGTEPDPKQSAELLHISGTGVNGSGRSTNISDAFASSLAESDGNGGVGVSQLIFGSPGASGDAVRQLVAQSLWTQTFVYNGTPTVNITLHLQIPALQVGLIGVPPDRTTMSAAETAQAKAQVDTVITHADGTFEKGGSFEFGLNEFERQLFLAPGHFENFADIGVFGANATLFQSLKFNGDEFNPSWSVNAVSTTVKLGTLQTGDTLAYVYTLTAEGTTHGFERGYLAFLGDPFGVDVVSDNLGVTVDLADVDVPEPSVSGITMLGLAALALWRKRARRSVS
ncbi:MAG TPA: PEP-CTERM sorting domain-containing protein [Bryobacteraceae bacterium]|nr:PEP-CTERM sorting domain-containing protein [Bryobacteraceae bacterium]